MTKHEKAQLKSLLQDEKYDALLKTAKELTDKWQEAPVIKDTQFKTLKESFKKEYKVNGLKEFLDYIERLALDEDA